MSGFEVLAAVTSIIAMFNGSATVLHSWIENRKERIEDQRNQQLQGSLELGGSLVEEAYTEHSTRLGPIFSSGDGISRARLLEDAIQLQNAVLLLMADSNSDEAIVMSSHLTIYSTSENVRLNTVKVLEEQYQRMVAAGPLPTPLISAFHRSAIRGSIASEIQREVVRRRPVAGLCVVNMKAL
ncbi:hypothetical protein BGZ60DRAFT_529093 [Tricladium varicosporioides]|nr:hypothetical protein BGZ60DRAFT_529093 [Hymenoscyphus varicosporioides]